MSAIAKILSFVRAVVNDAKVSNVSIDLGGGDNKTAQHFSAPGDDSFPLTTDYVLTSDIPRGGGKAAVGYLDPVNDLVALEGDKRIYGRDPATGATVNQVWLKSDGSILISNDNGSALLQAGGDFVINGVTIDTAGNITSPATITGDTDIVANGKSLKAHTHAQGNDGGGDAQVNTGPNI